MGLKQITIFICIILLSLALCSLPSLAETTNSEIDSGSDDSAVDNSGTGTGSTSGTSLGNTVSLDKGLSVDLLNQDPDPVKPGDVLEIRLAVENTGYEDLENCVLEVKPEYPFKSLSGEKIVSNIGTLGKRSESERRKVVKFKLGIENDVKKGQYPLKVHLYTRGRRESFPYSRGCNRYRQRVKCRN